MEDTKKNCKTEDPEGENREKSIKGILEREQSLLHQSDDGIYVCVIGQGQYGPVHHRKKPR